VSSILVIGSGGREHALAWKLSLSPQVSRIAVAPGNAGMPKSWERWPATSGAPKSSEIGFQALAEKAVAEGIDLVVVGPDNPLADGIVDVFEEAGLLVFGPNASAAQIEASKAFAKAVMKSAKIPTAKYWVAESQEEARKILRSVPWGGSEKRGWVVKADGLAFGKGVRVCNSLAEALDAVNALAGGGPSFAITLVIEERLQGEELSWMAFCDGERCALLQPVRDYKRLLDNDLGPNTGGMGSFSPVPGVPESWTERVRESVFLPALREMKRRNTSFKGLLYAGLMVDFASDQFWVLEFNARFGDPETQVLMPRIEGDLYPWLQAVAQGDLSSLPPTVPFKKEAALVVVAASGGYPDSPRVGKKITSSVLSDSSALRTSASYFFAGVKSTEEGGDLLTAGGRVLGALGLGASIEIAREAAYNNLSQIHFDEMCSRSDIGKLK
jgi:phosphoribosylamine--glycine ligase